MATTIWDRPERAGRGTSPLSREQIVRAAIALIDEQGPDALSMRRLAARMGVGAMSLYWHVEKKADLMELVADAVFGELDLPEASGDWRVDLRLIAIRTRALFLRHPWLLQNMGAGPAHFGPNFLRHIDFTFASLLDLGLTVMDITAIAGAVDSYVFGTVIHRTVAEGVELDAASREMVGQQFAAAVRRTPYPSLVRMQDAFESWDDMGQNEEHMFLFGLEAILDGLSLRVTRLIAASASTEPGPTHPGPTAPGPTTPARATTTQEPGP